MTFTPHPPVDISLSQRILVCSLLRADRNSPPVDPPDCDCFIEALRALCAFVRSGLHDVGIDGSDADRYMRATQYRFHFSPEFAARVRYAAPDLLNDACFTHEPLET